jgi:uncharacterized membrane protein YgaE (UPF0421/DUF939 family)
LHFLSLERGMRCNSTFLILASSPTSLGVFLAPLLDLLLVFVGIIQAPKVSLFMGNSVERERERGRRTFEMMGKRMKSRRNYARESKSHQEFE